MKQCENYGYTPAITDHGSGSGLFEFSTASSEKKILGVEFYICDDAKNKTPEGRSLSHMVILAKNKQGYKQLCKLISKSNGPSNYYYKPRIDWEDLREVVDEPNLIALTGHPGSFLFNAIYNDDEPITGALSIGEKHLNRINDIFGLDNVFLEIQRQCIPGLQKELSELLLSLGAKTGNKPIACIDAHYVTKEDAVDQRLLLASNLNIKLSEWKTKAKSLSSFFKYDHFHIPSPDEIKEWHPEEEIKNHELIYDQIEDYSLKEDPSVPEFECPDNLSEDEYLRQICRDGWRKYLVDYGVINQDNKELYTDRVKRELDVISKYKLSGYFLIVQDLIKKFRTKDILSNFGRGSCGGSLTAYLAGITLIDPIPHGLMFERFLNEGRFSADRMQFPDIDMDFPPEVREDAIQYLKDKYGTDHVAQIITFGTFQGKIAVSEALRLNNIMTFNDIKKISKLILEKSKVGSQMKDAGISSTIDFTIKHTDLLADYCTYDNGEYKGSLAPYFEQAIRIEGTVKNESTHAAGVIVSPRVLSESIPMVKEKSGNGLICGLEMNTLEQMGFIKFDVLGLANFSTLGYVNELLRS